MAFNEQQFIDQQKKKGIPESEIYAFLQSKGASNQQQQKPMFGTRGTTGGFLGYVAPVLATLPQAAGQLFGQRENLKTVQGLSTGLSNQADTAQKLLKSIQAEKDPVKKERMRKTLKDIQSNSEQQRLLMNELSTGEGVTKSTEIKMPFILNAPALRPGTEGLQQVAGRSIRQGATALSPQLGTTGSGALYGLGSGLERGSSPLGSAVESAGTALAFKTFGYAADKITNIPMVRNVLESPFGNSVLKVGNTIYSPFVAKPSTYAEGITVFPKVWEKALETQTQNFGSAIDKVFSPTFYRDTIKKGVTSVGEATGAIRNEQERLVNHQQKVADYWQQAKQRYQTALKYDDHSPEVLGREGIIPRQMGGSMGTAEEATIVRTKAAAEHSLLSRMLDKSQIYGSVDDMRNQGIKAITQNFKGVEREAALREFNKQLDSLLEQNSGSITDGRIPIKMVNDFKSYMWSQGYASNIAPKSDQVSASAMRTAGNSLKNYINSTVEAEDPAMAEIITKLNEHSGELFQAAKFLDFMNGKRLPGGFAGRYFARLMGAVIGHAGGVPGSITGAITAEKLAIMMQNPDFSVGKSAAFINQLKKTNPEVVDEAMKLLMKVDESQASRLLLPAGNPGDIPIPMPFRTPQEITGRPVNEEGVLPPLQDVNQAQTRSSQNYVQKFGESVVNQVNTEQLTPTIRDRGITVEYLNNQLSSIAKNKEELSILQQVFENTDFTQAKTPEAVIKLYRDSLPTSLKNKSALDFLERILKTSKMMISSYEGLPGLLEKNLLEHPEINKFFR